MKLYLAQADSDFILYLYTMNKTFLEKAKVFYKQYKKLGGKRIIKKYE